MLMSGNHLYQCQHCKMVLEKLSLFNTKKEFLLFILTSLFILSYSLLIEFNNYTNLTKFDSNLVNATVIKQYEKTKPTKKGKLKTYQVLKLKSDRGFTFYTTVGKNFPNSVNKKLQLEIWAGKISFYEYMRYFYAFSKVLNIDTNSTLKQKLNSRISSQHQNQDIVDIYQALYTATPLDSKLQSTFSTLGISHLFAISGFHLGVLAGLLFFLFKAPYKFFQNSYFPYRSYKVDSFIIISSILLLYLLFLDSPASLLRSFVMLVIGFVLYDRGFKIISMMTLFLTVVFILSFFPRLFFSIGFWLSVSGVFYIFLFMINFKHLSKTWQFILIPFWVYLMMLPISLSIFENFSLYHPISILWTTLFTLFYPLSILLHLIGLGDLLNNSLVWIISLGEVENKLYIPWYIGVSFVLLSLLGIFKRIFIWLILCFALIIFIYSIYNVAKF